MTCRSKNLIICFVSGKKEGWTTKDLESTRLGFDFRRQPQPETIQHFSTLLKPKKFTFCLENGTKTGRETQGLIYHFVLSQTPSCQELTILTFKTFCKLYCYSMPLCVGIVSLNLKSQ